ncbi:stage II sporulation protein P [Mesobacillus subterraneus]|uniref:stage II sporulation protein P n=1 Tax=Mesobacillus subterraneus TaxID=285983 RepID=UPI00203FE877|nr:stage II sporulation protein P [Mesobacillus subterraneus]MCM3664872.1 stage II sporulation protein P [Mesobacillus subterraneus]MCM3681961.1 stage II sporulation protein P [Mesobacillus subterraneus]
MSTIFINLYKRIMNILVILACTLSLFLLAGFISSINISFFKFKVNGDIGAEVFLRIISYENTLIGHALTGSNADFAIIPTGFKLITNIEMNDIRSLIRSEIPGFMAFDSNFLIADKGVNFTDIPIESAPPMEVLLQERNMAANELKELNSGNTPSGAPPSEKSVFIYHTHSWESYLPLLGLEGAENENIAVDGKTNITIVGDLLGKELEKRGIGSSVDKTNVGQALKNKGWQTPKSYEISRSLVQSAMSGNSNLKYFIDLHRDSVRKDSTTANINNQPYAKLVFVIGEENKNFQQNLKFANELHQILNKNYPGISKGVLPKKGIGVDGIYNQDLHSNSLVVEVGGVDNNMKELKNTVEALAEAISQIYWKAEEVNG